MACLGGGGSTFSLGELTSSTPSIVDGDPNESLSRGSPPSSSDARRIDEGFDARLRAKLDGVDAVDDDAVRAPAEDELAFDAVRALFTNAAEALRCELAVGEANKTSERRDAVPCHCHWVPGRIEVMGKHTDYAGGNSLVCATSGRGMGVVSAFVDDGDTEGGGMKVTIISVLPKGMEHHAAAGAAPYRVADRTVVHHTVYIPEKEDTAQGKPAGWAIYPTAVIHRLHANFGLFRHHDKSNAPPAGERGSGHIFIAISSNLPPASGLSTSSALVTGFFLALDSHLGFSHTPAYRKDIGVDGDAGTIYNLSTYLGNVENGRDYFHDGVVLEGTVQGGVGTFGGSEDHAAILTGRRGEVRLLSFCPTRPYTSNDRCREENGNESQEESVIHLGQDVTFVIAYSGAKAEKAGGVDGATDASIGYNSASELARKAFDAYFAGGDNDDLKASQTLADAIRFERRRLGAAAEVFGGDMLVTKSIAKRIRAGALVEKSSNTSRTEEHVEVLVRRFEHFFDESEYLVTAAARAMSNESYDQLGATVDSSHRGAVNLLKNQIEETAWLPLWARGREGDLQMDPLHVNDDMSVRVETAASSTRIKALAASAFGAGFGGSCWALVHRCEARDFATQWQRAYDERFPAEERASGVTREFFLVDPGPGACWV